MLLLGAGHAPHHSEMDAAAGPIRPATAPPLDAALARPLFTESASISEVVADDPGESALASDAPELVGVVGRLPDDAVAMVRAADGRTRTLRAGDSIDGWRLSALSIDAAFFTRGNERVRLGLPPS